MRRSVNRVRTRGTHGINSRAVIFIFINTRRHRKICSSIRIFCVDPFEFFLVLVVSSFVGVGLGVGVVLVGVGEGLCAAENSSLVCCSCEGLGVGMLV